jgi:signal peptidase II
MLKMTRWQRLAFVVLVVMVWVIFDQVTKAIARATLLNSPTIELLGGFVRLLYTENPGAILGLGATLPDVVRFGLFYVFVAVVVVAAFVAALKSTGAHWMQLSGLALLTAGGLGNLIDRLVNGGLVVDFMVLGIGPVHTGIFNMADVAVMAGMALVLLSGFRKS